MKKNRVFGKFHSWGHSNSVLYFLKFYFYYVWCIWKKKENDFWELKNIIYTHDTAIKNGQVHHWSLKTKIFMIYF